MIEEKLERIAQALEAIAAGGNLVYHSARTGRWTVPADEEASTAAGVGTVATETAEKLGKDPAEIANTENAPENAEKELTPAQKNKAYRLELKAKVDALITEGHDLAYTSKTATATLEKMIEKALAPKPDPVTPPAENAAVKSKYTAKDVREILWETVKEKNCEAEVGKILGSFNGEDGKPCVNLQFVQEKDYESLVAQVKEIK